MHGWNGQQRMGGTEKIAATDLADQFAIAQHGKTAIVRIQEDLCHAQEIGVLGDRLRI